MTKWSAGADRHDDLDILADKPAHTDVVGSDDEWPEHGELDPSM